MSAVLDGHVGALALAVLIALGSLVPVLPTGALMSAAAAVAASSPDPALSLLEVLLAGAGGAFVGDVVLYGIGARVGGPVLHRLAHRADPERLAAAQHELDDHNVGVLVVSRLLPAGRIPVVVAAVLVDLPCRRFVTGNIVAVVVWACCYMLLGTVGAAIFPEPWQGVVAAIVLVVLIALVPSLWRHAHVQGRQAPPLAGPADPADRAGRREPGHTRGS